MRRRRCHPAAAQRPPVRRAATTLEVALGLSLLVTLIFGTVDLGYGVFRQHVLTQVARQLARQSIVRGAEADRLTAWGPGELVLQGDDTHEVTDFVRGKLVGWKPEDVEIRLDWLDGGHDPRRGHRVQVSLAAPYRPLLLSLLPRATWELSATSTMTLAH